MGTDEPRDRARMHLAQAATRAENPAVREHVRLAREALAEMRPLMIECPLCGRAGLPEQIAVHDCSR